MLYCVLFHPDWCDFDFILFNSLKRGTWSRELTQNTTFALHRSRRHMCQSPRRKKPAAAGRRNLPLRKPLRQNPSKNPQGRLILPLPLWIRLTFGKNDIIFFAACGNYLFYLLYISLSTHGGFFPIRGGTFAVCGECPRPRWVVHRRRHGKKALNHSLHQSALQQWRAFCVSTYRNAPPCRIIKLNQ